MDCNDLLVNHLRFTLLLLEGGPKDLLPLLSFICLLMPSGCADHHGWIQMVALGVEDLPPKQNELELKNGLHNIIGEIEFLSAQNSKSSYSFQYALQWTVLVWSLDHNQNKSLPSLHLKQTSQTFMRVLSSAYERLISIQKFHLRRAFPLRHASPMKSLPLPLHCRHSQGHWLYQHLSLTGLSGCLLGKAFLC